MTEVNPHLNTTAAGLLAQKLDAQDGDKDGQIKASIWNDFVKDKSGKTIKSSIGLVAAMNSITTYAVRMAKQAGKTATDLCMTWFPTVNAKPKDGASNAVATEQSVTPTNQKEAESVTPKNATIEQSQQPVGPAPKIQLTEAETNVDEIVRELDNKLPKKAWLGACCNLEKVDKLKTYLKNNIKSENVAYIVEKFPDIAQRMDNFDALGAGFDEDEVFEYVLSPLQKRASYYGIASNVEKDSDLEDMEKEIARLAPLIREADKNAQKTFDGANKLLEEVANMTQPPEIKSGTNDEGVNWKSIKLEDKRWLNVYYDAEGEISQIVISHDTTPNKRDNGEEFDGADVEYTSDEAKFDAYKGNSDYEGCITEGYNFDEFKEYAEKIFGKWEAE